MYKPVLALLLTVLSVFLHQLVQHINFINNGTAQNQIVKDSCTSKEVANYCALKVLPSRRMKTTQPLPVAILNAVDAKHIEAKLVSKLTNDTVM